MSECIACYSCGHGKWAVCPDDPEISAFVCKIGVNEKNDSACSYYTPKRGNTVDKVLDSLSSP